MKKLSLLVLWALFLNIGCNRDNCTNTNPVLAANLPESEPYKAELAALIKKAGADNLEYYLDTYSEANGNRQLTVYVQGESICAKAVVLITETTEGLEGILRTKGMGYSGAELDDLQLEIVRSGDTTNFIYKGLDWIVD